MTTKSVDLPHLRSVVLAAHAGAGKTTLAERLLFDAGAITRLGRVDDGTASLDYEPEEQKRKQSLTLAVASLEHEGTRIQIVDTPGYADFAAEVVEGFAATDAAVLLMDASGHVEAGLESAVALARANGRPALFFINKCDRENANPGNALNSLRASFGQKIAPLHVAIGAGESFTGYVDLVHRKAYQLQGGKEAEVAVPANLADEVASRRDQLLEAASEADDDVMTKYLEGEEITDAELEACLHTAIRSGLVAPVLIGSVSKDVGVRALIDAIVHYLPSPAELGEIVATDSKGKEAKPSAGAIDLVTYLTSKGVAGVPRGALVILTGALATFNLPAEGIFLLLGIDTVMDMARTSVNVLGNCLASAVVARWEGYDLTPLAENADPLAAVAD